MKRLLAGFTIALFAVGLVSVLSQEKKMKYRDLTPEEERVIVYKGTERPFTGKYYGYNENGVYTCKRCGAKLYESKDKFDSHCGWPSFDDEIDGAVVRIPHADGVARRRNKGGEGGSGARVDVMRHYAIPRRPADLTCLIC